MISSALRWLGENSDRPFFVFLHFYDLHTPYQLSPALRKRFKGSDYDIELGYVDEQLATLWEFLNQRDLLKRVVLVTNYLITFFGVPIAAIWLGEKLSLLAILGGVLVLGSTLLITVWDVMKPSPALETETAKDESSGCRHITRRESSRASLTRRE